MAVLTAVATSLPCLADHGPGTSGSGFATQTAETLKKQQWSASTLFDWTEFDSVDSSRIGGTDHFDLLDRSYLVTFGASVGVTSNFQMGLSFGYYGAEGSRRIPHDHHEGEASTESPTPSAGQAALSSGEPARAPVAASTRTSAAARARPAASPPTRSVKHVGHDDGGVTVQHADHGTPRPAAPAKPRTTLATAGQPAAEESEVVAADAHDDQLATFDPDGWTDLWLSAKYRVYHGPAGQFALFGGIKMPVGETRVIDSTGARVEPASSPGTGAWDEMLGAAYTFAATPDIAFDASAQYTFRGEKFDYRLGNRFDAAVAIGWRVWGKGQHYPQASLMAEAGVRRIEKSEEGGIESDDTGGTAVFLSPGFRVAFGPHAAWSAGVQLPVLQELNGNQLETRFRVTTSFSVSF